MEKDAYQELKDKNDIVRYRQDAYKGDTDAQYRLGECYELGKGTEQNYEQALSHYSSAAKQGHIKAQYKLGKLYDCGLGTPYNKENAKYWYQEAAEQNYAAAQYMLGNMLCEHGMHYEALRAVKWYQEAAVQDFAPACKSLGDMYKCGLGVKQNYEKAAYWFQREYELTLEAAIHGDKDAQCALGHMYRSGRIGLNQNPEASVEWYQKAAVQGQIHALLSLGEIYENGTFVTQDYKKAIQYYISAFNEAQK